MDPNSITPWSGGNPPDFPPLEGYPRYPNHYPSVRDAGSNQMQRLIGVMRKHIWLIVSCITIVMSLAALYTVRQKPLYRATANIAIYRESAGVIPVSGSGGQEPMDLDDYTVALETQLRVLQSRRLALDVVRKLHLDQNPDFTGRKPSSGPRTLDPAESPDGSNDEMAAADGVLGGIALNTVRQTRVVQVSYIHPKPQVAAAVSNALVEAFIEDSIRARFESANRAARFLSDQLADLKLKVEESQKRVVEYQKAHDILGVDDKQNVITAKLDDINKQLTDAQADRILKEAEYQTIAGEGVVSASSVRDSLVMQSLRSQESELRNQYAQATSVYGPNNPKVIELDNRIKQAEANIQAEVRRVANRVELDYRASLAREQKLKVAFEKQKTEANRMNESSIEYGILKRELDSNRQLYDNLQERMKEAGVAAGMRSSNIRLIDSAEVPSGPISPNVPMNMSFGFIMGLAVAGGAVAMRESLNKSITDPMEVEATTQLPALAIIPLRAELGGERPALAGDRALSAGSPDVAVIRRPKSALAESYRALGTSILLSPPEMKTLVVTSPLPSEGKTTTTVNTAVVIAQQGERVLLIDADLRKPAVHRSLGLRNDKGLTNLLQGQASFEEVVQRGTVKGLDVLTSGPGTSGPAELLGSEMMAGLIARWREEYDYVLIDTPPVLAVTDAVRLSSKTDSVMMVMRSGHTTREALKRACDLFKHAKASMLGVVLNAVDFKATGAYYYGFYPDAYKSYYSEGR
jgi:capsular exopolysaccharide synthesis family protein